MTKVNRWLKIVIYFTCMRHFSCRWYGPPEVDLNGYPRISNPYYRDIQIWRCEWTQGKKMTQSKSQIKLSKGSIGGYPPHIYHHIFWQYAGQYVGPIFSLEKIDEYFCYHPEIFLGVFYDNLCLLGRAAGAINANYLGSVTHIAAIFKFGDVSGPRAKKDTK